MPDNPKILVLIFQGPYEPWLTIRKRGQEATWAQPNEFADIIHVSGRPVPKAMHTIGEWYYSLKWHRWQWPGYLVLMTEMIWKRLLLRWMPKVSVFPTETGENWIVEMPDFAALMGHKNLSAIIHSLSHNYNFLVTTITSSYLNLEVLSTALKPKLTILPSN